MHPRCPLTRCGANSIEKSNACGEGSATAQRCAINSATSKDWEPEKTAGRLLMPAAKPKWAEWELNPRHMDFQAKRNRVFRRKNADPHAYK
jgi:hypothetical protein